MATHTITVQRDKRIAPAERPTIAYNEIVTLLFRVPRWFSLGAYTSFALALDSDMRFFPGDDDDGLLAYSDEYVLDMERSTIAITLNTRTAKFRDLVNGVAHEQRIYLQLSAREGEDTPVHMVLDYVLASSIVNDTQGDPGAVPDLRAEMQQLHDGALQARDAAVAAKEEALQAMDTSIITLTGSSGDVSPGGFYELATSGAFTLGVRGAAEGKGGSAIVDITLGTGGSVTGGTGLEIKSELKTGKLNRCFVVFKNSTAELWAWADGDAT